MSIFDLLQRTQALVDKYAAYDAPTKSKSCATTDPFMAEYEEVEAELEKLIEAAHDVALESYRAQVASRNAEIPHFKDVLLTDAIDALDKKASKGKGVTKELKAGRRRKIQELGERIYAVPDGMSLSSNKRPFLAGPKGTKNDPIILDNAKGDGKGADSKNHHGQTDATRAFDAEWQKRKAEQDKMLDRIGGKVQVLGDIVRSMGEEVDKQNPILDDIEQQVDKNTAKLKSSNVKLKALVDKLGSSRNFRVDVILIVVLLAIGAYIFATFKRSEGRYVAGLGGI